MARLLRINRNLSKHHSATQIIDLLKELQDKYNKSDSSYNHGDQCAKTYEMVKELMAYIKQKERHENLHNSTKQSSLQKESKDIGIQADPKEIIGMINSKNIRLPSIFSPSKMITENYAYEDSDLSMIEIDSDYQSKNDK